MTDAIKKVEVEVRALLSDADYDRIVSYLAEKSCAFTDQQRVFIDFSAIERTRTISVKIDNGQPSLVVKSGAVDDASRSEATVQLTLGELPGALHALALLGYTEGSVGLRSLRHTMFDGVEVSLRQVLDYADPSHVVANVLEVEEMTNEGGEDKSLAHVKGVLAELGATELSSEEWKQTITKFHTEANGEFIYSDADTERLMTLLSDAQGRQV